MNGTRKLCTYRVNAANCNFTVRLESEEWRVEITETYGFRVSYAEFNGIDDKGNGSISLSSLYTLQSPLSRKFQFVCLSSKPYKQIKPPISGPLNRFIISWNYPAVNGKLPDFRKFSGLHKIIILFLWNIPSCKNANFFL